MTVIGEAFVAVRPETAGFGQSVESALSSALGAIPGPAIFGVIAAGAGVAALKIGEAFEGAYRTIRSGTGATEEQMAGLESSFKKVLASGPSTMDAVASALTLVSQRTKLSGADLEAFTQTELKLARITKTDVGTVVDATTKAFANYGIEGLGPSKVAMEQLLAVSQDTGIAVPALASAVSGKAGAAFRALGVDIGSAASIMGTLEAAGVQTGPVIMSMSKAITEAQKSGVDAKTALAGIFDTLKNGVPGTQAYEDAIKSLGARGFQSLRDAVQTGKISMDDFTGALAQSPGLIDRVAKENQSLGGILDTLKNKVLVALEPIGMFAAEGAKQLLLALIPALDFVGGIFSEISGDVQAFVAAFLDGGDDITSSGIAGWFESLGLNARAVFDAVKSAWDVVVFGFTNPDATVAISGLASTLIGFGQSARNIFDLVIAAWDEVVSGFQGTGADGPFATLGEVIRTVTDFISDNAMPIFLSFAGVFTAVLAGGAIELVAGAIGTVVSVLGFLLGALASPVLLIGALVAALVVAYQNSETFRNIIDTVASTLISFGEAAIPVIVDGFERFQRGVAIAGEKIGEFIDYWRTNVAPVIVPVLDHIGSSIADFARFFIDRWQAIHDSVAVIIQALVASIVIPIGIVVKTAMFIWDHFGEQIVAVLTFAWNEVSAVLDSAVAIVGDVFDLITNLITGQWGAAWDDVKAIFAEAFALIQDTLGNLGSFAVDFFSSLPGNILSALGDTGSALAPFAASALAFFASLPGKILEVLGGFAGSIIEWMGGALLSLAESLPGAFDAVATFFVTLPARILGMLVQADLWLVQTGSDMLLGLASGIIGFLPTLETWAAGLPKWFLDRLGDGTKWILGLGPDILQGLVNGLEFAIGIGGALWEWAIGLPGKFVGMLGEAAQWLVGLGGDILSGLTKGIDNAWGDITDYIKGKAGDLIHAFTHPWELGSPSKVTARLGGYIMEGLRVGLDEEAPDTFRAFEQHATSLMAGFANALGGSSGMAQDALDKLTLTPPGADTALPGAEQIGTGSLATDQTHNLLRELIGEVKNIMPVAVAVASGGTATTTAAAPDSETVATLRQVAARMRQP